MVLAAAQDDGASAGSPVARLALLVEQPLRWIHRDALVGDFFALVRAVEREENAIKLRTARLLVWAKAHDVSEARYPSWTAFQREHSPWHCSQTRALMRLAASEL